MELCEITLKDWMVKRNQSFENEEEFLIYLKNEENLLIFKRILQAVDYLHDKGIIHRDLKPQNIFMLENARIKVGDFGLATDDILSEDPCSPARTRVLREDSACNQHTTGVGTPIYAAPEQLQGSSYTSKADIYSLGLILFELYQKFDTEMEKYVTLDGLRHGKLPSCMRNCWPLQASKIELMVRAEPDTRPSVKEILADRNLFMSKDQRIAELTEQEAKITQSMKQMKISEKRAANRLRLKNKAVKKWREKGLEYSNEISKLKSLHSVKEEMMEAEMNEFKEQLKEIIEDKESEIKQLKRALIKKNILLKRKDKLLREKDAVIARLLGQTASSQMEDLFFS